MKKAITLIIACVIVFALNTTDILAEENQYDYTVLIYMNGSDLESYDHSATYDLIEMIQAEIGDNVAVVIETGGTDDWHSDEYGLLEISTKMNQRLQVLNDEIIFLENSGLKNIGESSTLEGFINYGIDNFPADNYALFFWNHGSGAVYGFGADEMYNYDSLTIEEMDTAFYDCYQRNNVTFDLVGFDACLMSSLEMADMLSDYAEYFVASEELEPGHGWNYSALLNAIDNNSQIEGGDLGQAIGEGYLTQSTYYHTEDTITLSVIDLSKVDPVKNAFEKMMAKVHTSLSNESLISPLVKIRLASESYGEEDSISNGSDMVDIGDYAKNLSGLYPGDSNNVLEALEAAVIYNISSTMKPNATGLSIYLPATDIEEDSLDYSLEIYETMGFSASYYDFLVDYSDVLLAGFSEGLKSDGISYSEIYGDNYYYYINVDTDDLFAINEVYTTVGYIDSYGDITYLGKDLVGAGYILDDGTIVSETADYWASLDGHFVSLYFDGYDESGALYYYIPIMINNEDYDLLVLFSDEYFEGKIVGARPLMDPDTRYYERELVQIEEGDYITLLYEYSRGASNGYEYAGWYEGESFTAKDDLELSWDILEAGQYAYSFEILDIYQNHYYSAWQLYDYYDADITYEEWLESFWDVLNNNLEVDDTISLSNDEIYEWLSGETDMPSTWALDYIDWAYYYGLTTESTLTEFKENISREEFCELVVNMYEISIGQEVEVTTLNPFSDTDNITVLKAHELGIVNGYADGTFRPDNDISREELIAMFYRALYRLDPSLIDEEYDALTFDDTSSISSWALESCQFMVYWDLISGVGNNRIAPKANATKEQALKIVTEIYEFYIINNI